MQVLHISCVAPPKGGGIGKVADQEVRALNKRGVQAWLACPKHSARTNMDHIVELPSIGIGNASWLRGLSSRFKDADVVHLHYPFYGTAGMVAKHRRNGDIKHLTITLHMDANAQGLRGIVFDLHRKFIQPKILESADKIFISSFDYANYSSYKDFIQSHPNKIVELPFGVDAECFCEGMPERNRFDMPAGCCVIGTVSVQDKAHQFKGIDLLIKAMVQLPEHMHLLLVGDGDMQSSYKALANDLKVGDRVHFTGRLSDEDLLCAYRTMDVFAFPSTNGAEAFGLAMLEAMACGKPVIASDLPGVRTVAEGAGILIQPNNLEALIKAVLTLNENRDICANYGRAAREKAKQYSWDNHTRELIRHYQQLCA